MGGIVSSLFGNSSPSIDVADPEPIPSASQSQEPVSAAVRDMERKRLKARRAFAGTLLTGGENSGGKKSSSLL